MINDKEICMYYLYTRNLFEKFTYEKFTYSNFYKFIVKTNHVAERFTIIVIYTHFEQNYP